MQKFAAIQMCASKNVEENLATAERLLAEAAKNGAKLVVLPEMFAIIGENSTHTIAAGENEGEGKIQNFLSEQAKLNQLWIVGGTIPIVGQQKNKIRAACLVFDDKGNKVARYDKIHLFNVDISEDEKYRETDTTEPGDKIVLIDTPFGKIGLAVCYDIRFPELFQILTKNGAEIIILPSAFTVKTGEDHWKVLARSTAILNFCYFIGACQGGQHHETRATWGHSLIVGPWGEIIAEKSDQAEGVIYAEIDLEKLSAIRASLPALSHGKITPNFRFSKITYKNLQ